MRLHTMSVSVMCVVSWMFASIASAGQVVPAEVRQPGTQPGEVSEFATNCDNCHYATDATVTDEPEHAHLPSRGWHGSMMAHSMRDPLFWATLAIAEQDFLPDPDPAVRGGVGDLCLRCHGPNGWLAGRSTPTDGSAMRGDDVRGVECEFCHLLVDPDPPVNVEFTIEQHAPGFEPFDVETGEAYRGSGQYVINGEGSRLGPYDDPAASHPWRASEFHRSGDLCGTCHDVSNPVVGDLAHNHGAQVPLAEGKFSGVLGSDMTDKAAFNNPPYRYGVVERTYSEWKASALDDWRVNDFANLPEELREPGGSLEVAHGLAVGDGTDADYVDGTPRYFTCQTCHMPPIPGKGCNQNNRPFRRDLPWHDLTGAAHWIPDAMVYQADNETMRMGTLDTNQRNALAHGKQRAINMLQSAAKLDASASGESLVVRVTNLTGHKLISGYPEGRRMWLNVVWFDATGSPIAEQGRYGTLVRPTYPLAVETILDPEETVVIEARPGMDQEWAAQLLGSGYDPMMPLSYDPVTDEVTRTLGDLGIEPAGTAYETFHFALNNVLIGDNRIPPYGFSWDDAAPRNALPVPSRQYGGRGPGTVFDHADVATYAIPVGAVSASVRLLYQQTSWEYIHFLWQANDGQSAFLGQEGANLLDAWLNTGMATPVELASTSLPVVGGAAPPGEVSPSDGVPLTASYDRTGGTVVVSYEPACGATDHTVYFGPLDDVASYAYSGAVCAAGAGGALSFDPGTTSIYFLIVGNNGTVEGSYGLDGAGQERPEDVETPICDLPRDLSGGC